MIRMRTCWRMVAVLACLVALPGPVLGQGGAPSPTIDPGPVGAYESLAPGEQKIARALYDAQLARGSTTAQTLTLDDIAARKQSGQGWGRIFRDMRAQGLVQEKNLGQVVSRYQRSYRSGVVTTAGGRQYRPEYRPAGGKGADAARGGARHSAGNGQAASGDASQGHGRAWGHSIGAGGSQAYGHGGSGGRGASLAVGGGQGK